MMPKRPLGAESAGPGTMRLTMPPDTNPVHSDVLAAFRDRLSADERIDAPMADALVSALSSGEVPSGDKIIEVIHSTIREAAE